MFTLFYHHSYFYYLIIGLDVICILHSIRNGTQNKWMLLIVFAPVIGALVYLYAEVFTRRTRTGLQDGISGILTTNIVRAEQEFKKMKGRFSHFEARLQYGLFLKRTGREQEARQVFSDMVDEAPHLSSRERRDSRTWIGQARSELKEN